MPMPQIIPPSLTVVPLDDPLVERHGFGPNSVYVEFVYLPILGATTVWLYRRLGVLVLTADSTVVDLAELGRNLGLGGAGRNAPLVRSLRRLELFGGASWNGGIYAVRRAVRARGHFPSEQAALKCLSLVYRSLDPTGTGRT